MSDSFLMIQGFLAPFLLGGDAQILSVHNLLCVIQLLGFPGGTGVKNLPANAGDARDSGSILDPLEKEMATPFSILASKIPWTEEPGRLQSMGSQRVGDNCVTKHAHMHSAIR